MDEVPDGSNVVIIFLENDKVSLTKRETLWRKVQLNRSLNVATKN